MKRFTFTIILLGVSFVTVNARMFFHVKHDVRMLPLMRAIFTDPEFLILNKDAQLRILHIVKDMLNNNFRKDEGKRMENNAKFM